MSESITLIPFGRLVESSTNPRKIFDDAAMAELVESIKSQGVLQPIVVRPLIQQLPGLQADDEGERFEVVFGHRRYRAAQLADVGAMPCIVRAMSDTEASQAQLHENLARADVHPIEEAEAYAALMKDHGATADQLVRQTGKSRSYIYGRLALLKACPAVRHACLAAEIGSETALLIARLRTDRLQQQALAAIKAQNVSLTDGGKKSFRHIREILREKFTLGLTKPHCIFDPADVFLVPDAGPCTTCPKRSGNAPEYEDIATDQPEGWHRFERPGNDNLCTDPDCFEVKKRAHLVNAARALEDAGKTVLAGAAARAAVSASGEVKGAYIPLAEARKALKSLPKKSLAGAPTLDVITIQDPRTGKLFEAMRKADLARAGVQPATADDASGRTSGTRHDPHEHERKRAAADLETRARLIVLRQVHAKAAEQRRTLEELQMVARQFLEDVPYDEMDHLAVLWGGDTGPELAERIDAMSPDELGLLLLDCALVHNLDANPWHPGQGAENLLAAAAHYGADIDAARHEAGAEGASTPSTAARAPEEGEGERAAAAGAGEAAADADDDADEGQTDEAGFAGNAGQTMEAGPAGLVPTSEWAFPANHV